MIRKIILTLSALSLFGMASAQVKVSCATDQFHAEQKARFPEIAQYESQLRQSIDNYLKGRASNVAAKGTFAGQPWTADSNELIVPVVVHLIHNYSVPVPGNGSVPYLTDEQVYAAIDRVNEYYNKRNPQLPSVIAPFKPYIGNFHITFKLATKDPQGNPTHGITRKYSYLTNGGDESAKIDPWPADQYLNIFLINVIGRGDGTGTVLAYATFPTSYASNPYSQGVISRVDQALYPGGGLVDEATLAHEIGHYLFLEHVWESSGGAAGSLLCGDDEVDDTPPTRGHYSNCPLYDTFCATNYYKDYDSLDYEMITGVKGNFYYNISRNTSVTYLDSSSIGQSFTTGDALASVASISLRADSTSGNGDSTTLKVFSGTKLLDSSDIVRTNPGFLMRYTFNHLVLTPNTTCKFVVNRVNKVGTANLKLSASDGNVFPAGMMYTGKGATVARTDSDLYFEVAYLRRIDYPDTANVQNIMDYSSCKAMFTKGQVARSRAALFSPVGFRNRLWTDSNLYHTGIHDANGNDVPRPDLLPVADFSVNKNFVCADPNFGAPAVTFTNRSYNDTIATAAWSIGKDAPGDGSTSTSVVSTPFGQIGWVPVALTVTSNSGSSTIHKDSIVYAADPTPVPLGYIQEFNSGAGTDLDKYPIFNYFNTDHRWEMYNGQNAGYYDNTSIRYANYDKRASINIANATATPGGDFADFYTPAFDLSGYGTSCNIDFFSAGAFRTNKPSEMNDQLEIFASSDCGNIWTSVAKLTKSQIGNNGLISYGFIPGFMGNWKEQSFPVASRGSSTFFRFRFTAGTDVAISTGFSMGTGNNFYLDRIQITANALGVKNGVIVNLGMSVSPNPTSGSATISLNGGDNSTAEVNVTDVTGKVVYHTTAVRKATNTKIEIPASVLTVKGMYLVQVVTNGATDTQKLIVY